MNVNLESVLPHKYPMILIDDILQINMDEKFVKCIVNISEDKLFYNKEINGISPLVGIEYMAQAIGCYAYYKAKESEPKVGFLLGTRLFENKLEKFENGKSYEIIAKEVYDDGELVSFECLIYNDGNEVARALINAFQPKNLESYVGNYE